MPTATKKAMGTAARLMATATQRVRARARKGFATVTRVAGDKRAMARAEGNKIKAYSNEEGNGNGGKRGQWWQEGW
jgi:hypothetical protein